MTTFPFHLNANASLGDVLSADQLVEALLTTIIGKDEFR